MRYQGSVEGTILIGWNEFVDIPDWGIRRLRAKVDTGARSSALHVENIEELPRDRVRFDVVLHRMKRDRRVHVTTPIARRGRVRSSTGHYETRIFVVAPLHIGPVQRQVEVSLVDRERMIFRMLLGRTALAGPFLIDPDRRHVLHPRRRVRKAGRRKRSDRG
ncbi:MAG: RimK/LysX family protein [Myxococcota bacterium]|nr:RimK/LysX family protein [Myxococcota bacterium]